MSANQETTRQNSDEQKKANKTEPKGIFGDDVDEDVDLFQDIGSSNEKKVPNVNAFCKKLRRQMIGRCLVKLSYQSCAVLTWFARLSYCCFHMLLLLLFDIKIYSKWIH